jgi:hypothetical protein
MSAPRIDVGAQSKDSGHLCVVFIWIRFEIMRKDAVAREMNVERTAKM